MGTHLYSLKSNLQKFKKWPFILTESSQTRISESERHGPNSPRPGLTSQPKRSPDDPLEPPRPQLSPHTSRRFFPIRCPMPNLPIQRQGPSRTRFLFRRTQERRYEPTEAKQIGICVDTRRRNKSAENLSRNV